MPNTPVLGLPYPSPTAPADIPADIQALANSVSTTLAASGTALPASPIDGQEFNFVADAINGVVWTFRYRAASSSAHKWEFVGGSPLWNGVATDDAFAEGGAYVDAATVGPQVTVPLAGDYSYYMDGNFYNNGGSTNQNAGLAINYAGTVAAPDVTNALVLSSGQACTASKRGVLTGRSAGDLLKQQYNLPAAAGGAAHVRFRELQVWPIRVG